MNNKTIVISAINIRTGGPLTILRDCLKFLSNSEICKSYRIIALVHNRGLVEYPNIEYIEFPKSINHWVNRLYYEYFYFKKLSKELNPYLWFSLHDISPNVSADRQVVYMHNPSIVNKIRFQDIKYDKTYILFALFYKYLYRINIKRNKYCIVQQNWFKEECCKRFSISKSNVIVASPNIEIGQKYKTSDLKLNKCRNFFFPSFPRPFKNFETICEAVKILYYDGIKDIEVTLTINSDLNSYSSSLVKKYSSIPSIKFVGLIPHNLMPKYYEDADCLIFPSRLETWGLPISEFIPFNKPMIIADLPYAHETSQGANLVTYFNVNAPKELAQKMKRAYYGDFTDFTSNPLQELKHPYAKNYTELFRILINDDK